VRSTLCMHQDFVYSVPGSMSDDEGALIEPLSVGVWACRKAGVEPGTSVLVTGAGPIGALAMQVARAAGAAHVTVSDIDPGRLATSKRLGADAVLDARSERPERSSVDVLLECSGADAAMRSGFEALRPAGRAVLVGMGADEVAIPLATLQTRELTITGTFRYANTYRAAIALAASGRVQLAAVIGTRYSLEDGNEALSSPAGDGGLKTIVAVTSPA
jgi:L-iditol 2-dehydrogenase